MASKAFSLDKKDLVKIAQAFGYSFASALLAAIIAFLAVPGLELPAWVVPLVPALNAALYAGMKFVEGRSA